METRLTVEILRASILTALLFLALACQQKSDESDRIATVTAGPRPCEYHVKLSWQSDEAPVGWVILRTEGTTVKATKLPPSPTEFVDSDVQCGKTYQYEVALFDGTTYSPLKKEEVTVPSDLEVTGTISAVEIKGHNRLFIRKGGKIQTGGSKFSINVNEIISEEGVIETFAESQSTSQGMPGRSGGSVHIKAMRGVGVLTIYSRGENGGGGATGATGLPGINAATGANGDCVKTSSGKLCSTYSENVKKMIIKTFLEPSRDLDPKNDYARKFLALYQCSAQPAEGGPGGQGGPGGTGYDGLGGGDSAEIYVEVQEAAAFEVKPVVLPGIGGKGGDGGLGGVGGHGGESGKLDLLELCKPAPRGPLGLAGLKGASGANGPSGKAQPVCIKIGALQGPQCERFAKEASN